MTIQPITIAAAKAALSDGNEIAFLDIREFGQYGAGHPFFSVNVPFSTLESDIIRLVPRKSVRCVIFDDGDGVADRAAAVMAEMGYSDIHVMTGGAPAWQAAGHTLFQGVNLPSKTFGELVEEELGTVSLSAEELHEMQVQGQKMVILDGRSTPEFQKMSIPGAQSCPNAELGYRLPELVDDETTPVIINCAGRTRSIIGAQGLRLVDVPNPVFALRNGTQGWRLSGFDLNHGITAARLPIPSAKTIKAAKAKAAELITSYGLNTVGAPQAAEWAKDDTRTTYLFDVRTFDEYLAGHLAGFVSAPGGQLVQATDEKLAVRGARIVLGCDTGLRAVTTAIWLAGMGHQVWILAASLADGTAQDAPHSEISLDNSVTFDQIPSLLAEGAVLLDASKGMDYRASHIASAQWVNRARLQSVLPEPGRKIIVTGRDAVLAQGIVHELAHFGFSDVEIALGQPKDWQDAGLDLISTPDLPSEAECIDYLFFVHDRHDGNLDAARRYLEWETGLLAQLDDQERGALNPLTPNCENGMAIHAS